ncbi:hypothetical protein SAMN05421740_104341 [Parapedobacter koreensis]|uniref:Uncharacterized protein n=1 Tax=Parapedobacter koreensis TaxID=332977 RepID=A0A1H7PF29_9SPHI|nr:hypothetical protein SAMN05421740_104341 [Parapedobacter koreensis]
MLITCLPLKRTQQILFSIYREYVASPKTMRHKPNITLFLGKTDTCKEMLQVGNHRCN